MNVAQSMIFKNAKRLGIDLPSLMEMIDLDMPLDLAEFRVVKKTEEENGLNANFKNQRT